MILWNIKLWRWDGGLEGLRRFFSSIHISSSHLYQETRYREERYENDNEKNNWKTKNRKQPPFSLYFSLSISSTHMFLLSLRGGGRMYEEECRKRTNKTKHRHHIISLFILYNLWTFGCHCYPARMKGEGIITRIRGRGGLTQNLKKNETIGLKIFPFF